MRRCSIDLMPWLSTNLLCYRRNGSTGCRIAFTRSSGWRPSRKAFKEAIRGPGSPEVRSKRPGAKTMKTHPSYSQMIKEAITALKDRKGSSRVAILKYISSRYQLGDNGKRIHSQLRLAIKKGIASGKFTLAKGAGVNGSFRLGANKSGKAASDSPKKPRMKKTTTAKKSPKQKPKADKPKPKNLNPCHNEFYSPGFGVVIMENVAYQSGVCNRMCTTHFTLVTSNPYSYYSGIGVIMVEA
ncbi:Linker histone H1 and H5 family protein [Dirofilaria immitis]|nr:Linker histone H1 and H5 family protein [Dirofilaria immitis]